MKRIIVLLGMIFAFGFVTKAANFSELASVDENYIETVFQDLNQLENYVVQHNGVTLQQLKVLGNALVANVEMSPLGVLGVNSITGEPPLGIPSFLWGCVLGWVGILIVYLTTDGDNEEVKKSLYGCIVGTVGGVLFYFVFLGLLFGTAAAGA